MLAVICAIQEGEKKMKKILSALTDYIIYIAGCAVYAAAVTALLAANEISPGGLTGIATVVQRLTGISSGITLMLLNIPILLLGFWRFGGRFIIRTSVVTVILSVFMSLAEEYVPPVKIDPVLAALFGGIAGGAGLGLVLLRGATTGGVDIVAKLLHRRFPHLSVGRIILTLDAAVILLAAAVYKNIESALYSVVAMYASSRIMDIILYGADRGRMIWIVTSFPEKLCSEIGSLLHRGVTVLPATGGYTGEPRSMLLCTVRPHEVSEVNRIVREGDPAAFIIVSDAGEVMGEGFRAIDSEK